MNRRRGLAGELLKDDGSADGVEMRAVGLALEATRADLLDHTGERRVRSREMSDRLARDARKWRSNRNVGAERKRRA